MSKPISISLEDGIASIRLQNPPVNALSNAVRSALREAAVSLAERDDIEAVVLFGDGRAFSAGADISEFDTEPPAGTPTTAEAIAEIEKLPVPAVAAIHGFAFGGGLELTLGAHYRIAASDTKMGLTEVDLGFIPGAGGTQRLPRLVGFSEAARLISSGARIGPGEALKLGLIDEIFEGDAETAAIAFAKRLIADGKGARPTSANTVDASAADIAAVKDAVAKKTKGRVAPLRAIDAIANAAGDLSFEDGVKKEREIFLDLLNGVEARAMRHQFRAERQAQKVDDVPADFQAPEIVSAGVIGLGTMGQGIALVMARAGIEVTVVDVAEDRLDAGLEAIADGLADRVARGRMTQDAMDAELSSITGTTDMEDLADVDVVIEAALEDMDLKRKIFSDLDRICRTDTILASNTSSLDMNAIAAVTNRPELVAGAHFFAPAQVMKLLEIVRADATAPETAATLIALGKRIGKVPVCVGNGFGFVANRMYHRYTWQAYFLLQEGAEPAQVDAAMQDFGFPMGCLAVGDMSGLDVAYHVRKAQREIGDIDPAHPYPVIADRIVEKGWLGRKTKRGWYDYADGKPAPDANVSALIASVSDELGIQRREIAAEEIQERCLFALINEGARLLGNGVAKKAGDIDIVWRYGYGFPVWRGGPMFMADDMGLPKVLETLERLCAAHGPAFEPASLIRDRVAAGETAF